MTSSMTPSSAYSGALSADAVPDAKTENVTTQANAIRPVAGRIPIIDIYYPPLITTNEQVVILLIGNLRPVL
jgi:hypothetical protein